MNTLGAIIPIPGGHSPDEIRGLKENIRSRSGLLDYTVRTCSQLDDLTRAGWGSFYIAAQDFAASPTPGPLHYIDLNTQFEAALIWRGQIDEWQARLEQLGCRVPYVKPPRSTSTDLLKETLTAVAGAATAVAVAAGVIYFAPVVRDILQGATKKKKDDAK